MKMDLKLSVLALVLTLTACGGSDAVSDAKEGAGIVNGDVSDKIDVTVVTSNTTSDVDLSLTSLVVGNASAYSAADLYKILPSTTFIIGWGVDIFQSDSVTEDITNNLYTSTVYLSDDEKPDSNDLVIAEMSCDAGASSLEACNNSSGLQCSYLTNGDNIITCDTVYAEILENSLVNYVSSLDSYLDAVPKSTYVVVQACLVNDNTNCDTMSQAITLY